MYTKAIKYKDWWLAPGSTAFHLHEEKKTQELDKHLKDVQNNYHKLIEKVKQMFTTLGILTVGVLVCVCAALFLYLQKEKDMIIILGVYV